VGLPQDLPAAAEQIRGDRDALQRSALTGFYRSFWSRPDALPDGERPRRCAAGFESRTLRATGPEQNPNGSLEALAETLLEPVARRARQAALQALPA
jgi:hypothetical protein